MLQIRAHKDVGKQIDADHISERIAVLWTSQNGRSTYIADMDSNHLSNAVAKIERGEHESRRHFLKILKDELIYRLNIKYGD